MRQATVIVALLLLAGMARAAPPPPPPPAPAERFITEKTILAAEADLSKADATGVARFVTEFMLACVAKDAEELARARADAPQHQAQLVRWMNDFSAATRGGGPCAIVCVTEQEWTLDGAYALYVAVPPAGDAARVEVLLGGGPEARKRKQNQPRHRFDWHSDVKIWPGGIVGQCVGASREPPAPRQPRRPEFVEALSAGDVVAAGGSPAAQIALVPDDQTREMVAQSLHAGWEFIKPMKWLAVRYDVSPLPLTTPAKLTITYRAQDPDAARAVVVAWTLAIDAFYSGAGVERTEVLGIVRQLTPTVDGDRAVLSIEADEIPRLIAACRPAIRKAWRLPPPPPSTRSARRNDAVASPPDGRVEVGYD